MRPVLIRQALTACCQLRRCQDCGTAVGARDKYCAKCGAKLPREPRNDPGSR